MPCGCHDARSLGSRYASARAEDGNRGSVKVERPFEGFIRGNGGIIPRSSEEIQGILYLREEAIPELDRAIDVERSQRSDHVILCRLDCCFGGVHMMAVWLNKLNVGILAAYECFDDLGAFVVEDVEPRLDTLLSEVCIQFLEHFDHVVVVSGGEWLQ